MEDDEVVGDAELTATLGSFRRDSTAGKPGERKVATSSTKCFGCGQYGHFKSDCPLRKAQAARQGTRTSKTPETGCLICKGKYFARNCPVLQKVQQSMQQDLTARPNDNAEQTNLLKAPP